MDPYGHCRRHDYHGDIIIAISVRQSSRIMQSSHLPPLPPFHLNLLKCKALL
jgi:hypothetical protein